MQDLKLKQVTVGQTNARNAIFFQLQNPTSVFLNRFEIEAEVTEQGEKQVLYKASQKNMQVAPNSHFSYPIALKGERFKPGKYTLHLKAKSSEENWVFTKNFQIDREKASHLNKMDVELEENDFSKWWIVMIVSGVILLFVLFFNLAKKKA